MRRRKIIILGSRGMLGQMAMRFFSKEPYDTQCFDARFDRNFRNEYSSHLRKIDNAIVINCIGRIKQKTNNTDDLLFANTILPSELRNSLQNNVVLVQASTDCIFNGNKGEPYNTDDPADAGDDYGWSKRLGEVVLKERPNTLVMRVSIIGPDQNPDGKGFMAWVMSQRPGHTVNGFTNHLWNGITTLEWCRQAEKFLIQNDQFDFNLKQYGTTEYHSKYEMVNYLNEIYNLQLHIESKATDIPVDRRLVADIECKGLYQQLIELKSF